MLTLVLIITLILSGTVICGAFFQKDIFLKLLFLNNGTSLTALFICFLGIVKVNNSYIDIAFIYFILSAIATNAYLRFFINKHRYEITKERTSTEKS